MKPTTVAILAFLTFLLGVWSGSRVEREVHLVEVWRAEPTVPDLLGIGEYLWTREPGILLNALRHTEGVPSYGVLPLGARYGGHRYVPEWQGRQMATVIVGRTYAQWVVSGRRGEFLVALRNAYCGPQLSCPAWVGGLLAGIPDRVLARATRRVILEESQP